MGTEAKTEQVMVRLTPELKGHLQRRAEAEDCSVSQVIRMAVRWHLAKKG